VRSAKESNVVSELFGQVDRLTLASLLVITITPFASGPYTAVFTLAAMITVAGMLGSLILMIDNARIILDQ